MMKNKIALATLSAIALTSFNANAEININGFASIVAGKSLDDDASLFGYDDEISFNPESLFALQLSSDVGEGLSATAQVIARGENDFDAEFEWAYISYDIGDNGQIKAGKMRIPFYRYSDFLDVGYAYNWLRPPSSVYNFDFSTYEGLSYIHNNSIGDWDSTLQFIFGSYEGDINVVSATDPSSLENMMGVNWSLAYEWLNLRAAYIVAQTSIDITASSDYNQLTGTLSDDMFQGAFNSVVKELDIEEEDGSFFGIGFSIDYENILVDAEFTQVKVDESLIADQEQYYLSLGYRYDEFTFIATYENRKDEFESSKFGLLPADFTIPGVGDVPLADPSSGVLLRDLVDGFLRSQELEQDVYSYGVRYDFHPSATFKVDHTTRDRKNRDEISVLSAGVNLVF